MASHFGYFRQVVIVIFHCAISCLHPIITVINWIGASDKGLKPGNPLGFFFNKNQWENQENGLPIFWFIRFRFLVRYCKCNNFPSHVWFLETRVWLVWRNNHSWNSTAQLQILLSSTLQSSSFQFFISCKFSDYLTDLYTWQEAGERMRDNDILIWCSCS